MPEPDNNSMRRMQEEAARRAREMQSRARRNPAGSKPSAPSAPPAPPAAPPPSPPPAPGPPPAPPPVPPAPGPALPVPAETASGGLLEELFKDRERTVLLALLILLGAEGGNNELMFALLFLLM